jgi:hypothetical protein
MTAFFRLSVVLGADSPKPSSKVEGIHDLASISLRQAENLHGRKARYRVTVDSMAWTHENYIFYDCQSIDDVSRTMWFFADEEVDEERVMIVEGCSKVIHHLPTVGEMGTKFPGFMEYRLMDVQRVRGSSIEKRNQSKRLCRWLGLTVDSPVASNHMTEFE